VILLSTVFRRLVLLLFFKLFNLLDRNFTILIKLLELLILLFRFTWHWRFLCFVLLINFPDYLSDIWSSFSCDFF